jgi:sugar phosphate isomerase/epimerase
MIDLAGSLGAPAIIGSMQGRSGDAVDREAALGLLTDALEDLGGHAGQYNVPLLYEPLNRYETDLANTVADGVALLETLSTRNVRLLADLFHMNIEEQDLAGAVRAGGRHVGHVHFVDSNRRAAGLGHTDFRPIAAALKEIGYGHTDFRPIAAALKEIGYQGYAAAEALPYPDPDGAARQTITAFRSVFRAEG